MVKTIKSVRWLSLYDVREEQVDNMRNMRNYSETKRWVVRVGRSRVCLQRTTHEIIPYNHALPSAFELVINFGNPVVRCLTELGKISFE